MKRRWQVIGLILLLALPLALVLRDFAEKVAVIELLRIVWAGRILIASLPQLPIWAVFLVIVVAITLPSLFQRGRAASRLAATEQPLQGPVRVLARRIQRAMEGEYFKWRLSRDLEGLIVDVLAARERLDRDQIKELIANQELDLPPALVTFLRQGSAPAFSRPSSILGRFQHLGEGSRSSHFESDLESAIRYLEDQLEVSHDDR